MAHSEVELALFYYDLAIREIERATCGQVKLTIVHRYGATSTNAERSIRRVAGTEIVSAWVIFRGRSYRLPLSTTHLILLDYLCWHCAGGIGQTASEVEAGLNEQLFYVHHASTANRRGTVIARSSRTSIKKQVERIRRIMAELFETEDLMFDPDEILHSDPTSTREIRYSIRAVVTWEN